MPTQMRARCTYDLVLDAAATDFSRYGFGRTNLQGVANRLGLTKGALYGHFSSKEEIAARLIAELDQILEAPPDAAGAPGRALDRLHALLHGFTERVEQDIRIRGAVRLVVERAQSGERQPEFLRRLKDTTVTLVRQAQRDGDLYPDLPSESVADLLVAVPFGTYYLTDSGGCDGLSSRVDAVWSLLAPLLRTSGTSGADAAA
ncbi:hypothetical protein AQ490_19690 [Wenjunlia vitaminophila]|uniref:HTH tetR-type domain-containing protein n=1 Tax=Wenjunlia vitaminophila TaxID=76728 RepID=A0A0T6LUB5_WENVI|nr:TetR/AcrR family transcriptional regulator [Wenjunlia vitaminophila]KRV49553.1 hypothetical protein AQ490_19690 [Wenjunlia vitaminophila]